jgi:hypothetical protein
MQILCIILLEKKRECIIISVRDIINIWYFYLEGSIELGAWKLDGK